MDFDEIFFFVLFWERQTRLTLGSDPSGSWRQIDLDRRIIR